jgi:hypothetical protein
VIWYEILRVQETTITLRVVYGGAAPASTGKKKNVTIIEDDGLITVNTIGLERSGIWIKTASDAVKDLCENDAGLTNLNTDSFTEADEDAPYIVSMAIPDIVGGSIPLVREVISLLNQSVFGSLVNNESFEVVYNILTPQRPEEMEEVQDHDILDGFDVNSRNEIFKKITLFYSPFTDRFKDGDTFQTIEFENDFVTKYIGATQEVEKTAFLYNAQDAQTIAERFAFHNSLSQGTVKFKTKLKFMANSLNDIFQLSFDRLYKRFGGRNRKKIAIISKIVKDGKNCSVEMNDLGNIWNRTGAVALDTADDFTSAQDNEKLTNAYIVDDDLEVPDITSEQELGQNLIG